MHESITSFLKPNRLASLATLCAGIAFATAAPAQSTDNCATSPSESGEVDYCYDALGRLVGEAHGDGRIVSYAYDNAGNRTRLSVSGANSNTSADFVIVPLGEGFKLIVL